MIMRDEKHYKRMETFFSQIYSADIRVYNLLFLYSS